MTAEFVVVRTRRRGIWRSTGDMEMGIVATGLPDA
jgi:hypothetical protein